MLDDYSREGLGIEVDLSLPSERVWYGSVFSSSCPSYFKVIFVALITDTQSPIHTVVYTFL